MINIKKSILGCFAVSAAISAAFLLPTPSHAAEASAVVQSAAKVQTGLVQASVELRDKPSLSSHVLGYLKRGERVTILPKHAVLLQGQNVVRRGRLHQRFRQVHPSGHRFGGTVETGWKHGGAETFPERIGSHREGHPDGHEIFGHAV